MIPSWFVFSIATSFIYSIINHIDKGLLDKYFKDGGVEVLLIFSAIFAFFGMPYAIFMEPNVLSIEGQNVFIMLVVAMLNIVLLYCYLKALEGDEPTVVILYYQLIPVIALGMGYSVLDETISSREGMAMVVVLLGTTLASFERTSLNGYRFKRRTCFFMLIATTCWAAEVTLGKVVILSESVYHSIFWESLMMVLLGVSMYCMRPKSRRGFSSVWKLNSKYILALMIFSEALYAVGNIFSAQATALKTVAIVLLSQPMQTVFVFTLGIFLTIFFPKIYKERIEPLDWIQKTLAILIAGFGNYLLIT